MCLPALSLLRQAGYSLTLCGRPWAGDLFTGLAPEQFIPLGQSFRDDLQAVRIAARARLPRGIVFTNSFSSAALFRLAGVPAAGYRGDARSLLLKWPQKKPAGRHEVEVFYELARAALADWEPGSVSPPRPGPRLKLPITAAHRQAADRALADAGLTGPFVLLAPVATGLHHGKPKAWPLFGELVQALRAHGWTCAVCPPPNELESTRLAAPGALVLPSLKLGAFAALTTRAQVVICNDSGTSHVAAAAGARQITLFGVTRWDRTGPWSPDATCLGSDTAWPPLAEVADTALSQLKQAS